jgi:hypothetical protein
MKATIQTIATVGGPIRRTKSSSARVCAEHRKRNCLKRYHKPVAAAVATAFTANSIAKDEGYPEKLVHNLALSTQLFSFSLALDDRAHRVTRDLSR